MTLKILSWNIWTDGYFEQAAAFLREANADIVGLQEVKADDPSRDFIGLMAKLGYKHVFTPVKKLGRENIFKYDGIGIWSKFPIRESRIFNLSEDKNRCAIQADIKIGKTALHLFCTHLLHTHQKPSEVQEMQADKLLEVLPEEKTILMGDFNATPDGAAIKKMKKVLADTNSLGLPTWSVYPEGCTICNPQKIDTRLDYIFASKDLKFGKFEVGQSKASDHLPIYVSIEI